MYSPFGIGQSLYDIPFYLVGRVAERQLGARAPGDDLIVKAVVDTGNLFAAAAAVALTFVLAASMTGNLPGASATTWLCAFATPLWIYAKFGYPQPLATALLLATTLFTWQGATRERACTLAGTMLALGIMTRHEFIVLIAPLTVWIAATSPSRTELVHRLRRFLPPVLIALAAWMTFNAWRFGNPLRVGFQPQLSVDGFWGFLFSPGGSLFLYAPITTVAIFAWIRFRREDMRAAALLGSVSLTLFVVYALQADWAGGRSYGPRYLVPIVPLLLIPIASMWRDRRARRMIVAVGVVSLIVQLPGVLVDFGKVHEQYAHRIAPRTVPDGRYAWEASALRLNLEGSSRAVAHTIDLITDGATRGVVPKEERGPSFAVQFADTLDFWWAYLIAMKIVTPGLALALGLVPLVSALPIVVHAKRLLRRDLAATALESRSERHF